MDYRALLQAADRGDPPPLALLHGGDAQLIDDALARVTAGLFADPTELALGREVLEGDETTAEAVVRSAMTLPLMTRRRLVVVRRCQALPARGARTSAIPIRAPACCSWPTSRSPASATAGTTGCSGCCRRPPSSRCPPGGAG